MVEISTRPTFGAPCSFFLLIRGQVPGLFSPDEESE